MTRSSLIAVSFVLALSAAPASAQFGNIFRDEPPRPRGDIPGQQQQQPQDLEPEDLPPQQQPRNLPQQQNFPQQQPRNFPSNRQDTIQSQPLEPLRGTETPQQAQPQQLPQPQQQQGQIQTLPGLPQGQRQPRGGVQQQPSNAALQPGDEIVVAPPAQKINNPTAVFSGLDKITGRITTFDVAINETVQFGALQVTPKVCYSRPPTETPNTDAFVVVDEVTLQGDTKRIFDGWMFAASPGLHGVEHPVYDVWLTDCKGGANPAVAEAPAEKPQQSAKPQQPAQQRAPARPQQPGFNIFR